MTTSEPPIDISESNPSKEACDKWWHGSIYVRPECVGDYKHAIITWNKAWHTAIQHHSTLQAELVKALKAIKVIPTKGIRNEFINKGIDKAIAIVQQVMGAARNGSARNEGCARHMGEPGTVPAEAIGAEGVCSTLPHQDSSEISETARLVIAIEESLDYFRAEFPKDNHAKVWAEPVSYHCGGITPNDLEQISAVLRSQKPVSLAHCAYALSIAKPPNQLNAGDAEVYAKAVLDSAIKQGAKLTYED